MGVPTEGLRPVSQTTTQSVDTRPAGTQPESGLTPRELTGKERLALLFRGHRKRAEILSKITSTSPEDVVKRVLERQASDPSSVSPKERREAAKYARENNLVEVITLGDNSAAEGQQLEQTRGIEVLGIEGKQRAVVDTVLEEAQISLLEASRNAAIHGDESAQKETFDRSNSRQVVVRKEGENVIVTTISSVNGNEVRINPQTQRIEPVDGSDLEFTFASIIVDKNGDITSTALRNPNVKKLPDGQLALQEKVSEVVRDSQSAQWKWRDIEFQLGVSAVPTSKLNKVKTESPKPGEERMITDEEKRLIEDKTTTGRVRLLSVYRAGDVSGENSDEARELEMELVARKLGGKLKTNPEINGATMFAGPAEGAHFVKELNVRGADNLLELSQQAEVREGQETPKIPLLVTADQKVQLDGLTRKARENLLRSQGMESSDKYDVQVYDLEAEESANLDRNFVMNDAVANQLKQTAERQKFIEQAIMDRDLIDVRIGKDADVAYRLLDIIPDIAYTPAGSNESLSGLLAADRAMLDLETGIKSRYDNQTGESKKSLRQIAKEAFAEGQAGLRLDDAQIEKWNKLRDDLYSLSDGEHVAKARAKVRDVANGQTIEQWKDAVSAELALAKDLETPDRQALFDQITSPKIDYIRVLGIKTQKDLDEYDAELRASGYDGMPDSIKEAVKQRLVPELTWDVINNVRTYEDRKKVEEQFADRLSAAQRSILERIEPEPQKEKTLEQRLQDRTATVADLDTISQLFGYRRITDLFAALKTQEREEQSSVS